MSTPMIATCRDHLEAKARRLMAARVEARGWDSARKRADWLADVDAALDAYNADA